jgi:transposase
MIPSGVKIFLATSPVDMRRSFDGLAELVRQFLGEDPASGALFVFFNKKHDRLKLVWHERRSDCLLYKRLIRGVFRVHEAITQGATTVTVEGRELAAILEGIELPARRETPREISHAAREAVLHAPSQAVTQKST